ncbi:hypothetical protein [Endozoicomonas lisbonensis]|uniref:Uncharacterized protein n=1 Tax=Endozoicomonas lisbonensis TaxID=3120522 RepID=A0ABV2SDE5_9GAMM
MLTLEQVMSFRDQMFMLECLNPVMSRIAPKRLLFELCRSGEIYYLKRTSDNKVFQIYSWKVYIFVILASRPTQVFCVPKYNKSTNDEINFLNFPSAFTLGHTSITRKSPVFYAGELVLENTKLFAWDNRSGHYKTPDDAHKINFLPPVKHLLPLHKSAIKYGAEKTFIFSKRH